MTLGEGMCTVGGWLTVGYVRRILLRRLLSRWNEYVVWDSVCIGSDL